MVEPTGPAMVTMQPGVPAAPAPLCGPFREQNGPPCTPTPLCEPFREQNHPFLHPEHPGPPKGHSGDKITAATSGTMRIERPDCLKIIRLAQRKILNLSVWTAYILLRFLDNIAEEDNHIINRIFDE